jgi:hypothetical protein
MLDNELEEIFKILEYEEKEYIKFINKNKQIVVFKSIYNQNFINYFFICANIYNLLLYINLIDSLIINNLLQIQC